MRLATLLLFIIVLAVGSTVYLLTTDGTAVQNVVDTARGRLGLERLEIITPPPLRGPLGEAFGTTLTQAGVFSETNRHRATEGLPALTANATLDLAATAKVNDMFAQQYFEHVGPDGRGPSDWVDDTGYRYLRVGENLALGNFADDAALVQAWMDSPGHRANILSPGFTELGLAVGKGTFEGHTTWLAVQTFALPESACPTPNAKLRRSFEQDRDALRAESATLAAEFEQLEARSAELSKLRQEIEQLSASGNKKIEEGNAEIQRGNEIYQETGSREEAQPHWDRGEQLQAEGRAELERANELRESYNQQLTELQRQQETYNTDVAALQQREGALQQLVAELNRQIGAFNTCLSK